MAPRTWGNANCEPEWCDPSCSILSIKAFSLLLFLMPAYTTMLRVSFCRILLDSGGLPMIRSWRQGVPACLLKDVIRTCQPARAGCNGYSMPSSLISYITHDFLKQNSDSIWRNSTLVLRMTANCSECHYSSYIYSACLWILAIGI